MVAVGLGGGIVSSVAGMATTLKGAFHRNKANKLQESQLPKKEQAELEGERAAKAAGRGSGFLKTLGISMMTAGAGLLIGGPVGGALAIAGCLGTAASATAGLVNSVKGLSHANNSHDLAAQATHSPSQPLTLLDESPNKAG
jgi:hypothetical protein